jgi:phosphatidate cytidylyltransferase
VAPSPSAAPGPLGDLGRRLVVVVVGIPAVLALLYFGRWVLGAPVAVMAALAVREIYRLAGSHGVRPLRWLGMTAAAALVLAAVQWPRFPAYAPVALSILGAVAMTAMVGALFSRGPRESPLAVVSVTLFGVAYGGLSLACAVLLQELPRERAWGGVEASAWMGTMVVVLPLAATWIGDAAAYFAGSAWGKRKLAPTISPKKSWVGLWAELVAAGAAGAAWFLVVRDTLPRMPVSGVAAAAALGVVLGLGAVVGDLAESLFKREAGVKDSGTFFPGHGGVLDRVDALVFTLPLAYVLLAVLGMRT